MNLGAVRSHFANWRQWEFNPVVIKELRQGVRSWTIIGLLTLFLIVMFCTAVGFLLAEMDELNSGSRIGMGMFAAFTVILTVTSVIFLPLYVGVRMSLERQENNLDLLYVSTLTPERIIRGKFLCGAYFAVLFFSACMPFMAFTTLMRGVDLPSVFVVLAYLFLMVCAANMFAIFLACLPASRPLKALFLIIGLVESFANLVFLVNEAIRFAESGTGAMLGSPTFWKATTTAVIIGAVIVGLFYALSVALISPPSSNRALPLRIYVTVGWAALGLLIAGIALDLRQPDVIITWAYGTFALICWALPVVAANSDRISERVRRTIPGPRWKRAGAFLFYNGAAGGLVWIAIIAVATYAFVYGAWTIAAVASAKGAVIPSTIHGAHVLGRPRASLIITALGAPPPASPDLGEFNSFFPAAVLYGFAYALTAIFIHRTFFPRRVPKMAAILAIALAGLLGIAPIFRPLLSSTHDWQLAGHLFLGSAANLASNTDAVDRLWHLLFATSWFLLAAALNARWFRARWRDFVPPAAPPAATPSGV